MHNSRGDTFKATILQLSDLCDLDLDLGSGHTAYRRESLIDLYLHTKFPWNQKSFLWTDRPDVRMRFIRSTLGGVHLSCNSCSVQTAYSPPPTILNCQLSVRERDSVSFNQQQPNIVMPTIPGFYQYLEKPWKSQEATTDKTRWSTSFILFWTCTTPHHDMSKVVLEQCISQGPYFVSVTTTRWAGLQQPGRSQPLTLQTVHNRHNSSNNHCKNI